MTTEWTEKYSDVGDLDGWLEGDGWFASSWFGDATGVNVSWQERSV